MSKVFISHSSKDSELAKKLAHDLLSAEIPVWLDTYELSIGDSLYDKIFSGINQSNFLIVLLSEHYNASLWTSKEFRAILAKEDADQKKYLIPIKTDNTPVPLEIGDRIYKQFAADYQGSIKTLIRFLKKEDLSIKSVPIIERQLILNFIEHTHPDIELIKSILPDLHEYQEAKIHKKQIYFNAYESIDHLLNLGKKNVTLMNDKTFIQQFNEGSRRVETLISNIHEGLILILNEYKRDCNIELISISIYWFIRISMDSIYAILTRYLHQNELNEHKLSIDQFTYMPTTSSMSFGKFYQVRGYARLDIFDKSDTTITCAISVDEECFAYKELQELILPVPFRFAFSVDLMYKYLIPQNVQSRIINGKHIPLLNDFDNYHVGLR